MDDWKQKLWLRVPVLVLLAVTILFWTRYERFEPAGPVLLESPQLADGIDIRGDVSQKNGDFILRVSNSKNPAHIYFPLPPAAMDYEFFRVRARIRVDGVVAGRYAWNHARLLLEQYDERHKWIPGRHVVVAKEGSWDWTRHEEVLERLSRAAHMAVVVQQGGVEGAALFDQIAVEPIRLQASFFRWRNLFVLLWLVMAVVYFRRCRLHSRRLRIWIILNAMVILAGTLVPGAWINANLERANMTVREILPSRQYAAPALPARTNSAAEEPPSGLLPFQRNMAWFAELDIPSYHAGHFILFATLCFLVYLSAALEGQHPAYFLKVGADVLLFAAVTESLQFLTLDRNAGMGDLRTDLYGMVLALLLFLMVLPVIRRYRAKSV